MTADLDVELSEIRGYVSPSTGRPIRAVLFDTFGTVVDWRSGIASAVDAFAKRCRIDVDGGDFADLWRSFYVPSMTPIVRGERAFVDLDTLHRENLERSLIAVGVAPGAFDSSELDRLTRAWHTLPAWPDSSEGLARIKERYIVGPLSNGHTALLVALSKHAGLPWDAVIGSDITRSYKPDPRIYVQTPAWLGLEPGEVMLAASHNADLAAAQPNGLATAFIRRPVEHGPNQTVDLVPSGDWDLSASTITDLAARLCGPTSPSEGRFS